MKYTKIILLCCALFFAGEAQAGNIKAMTETIKKPITMEAKKSPLLNVTFNHSSHRGINCFTCHHAVSEKAGRYVSCTTCHESKGRSNDAMSFFAAAHMKKSMHSCYSCHSSLSKKAKYEGIFYNCRPCHTSKTEMPKADMPKSGVKTTSEK